MLGTLLVVIFISFIGVGLPDSVLGAAWPSMYREFSLPISLAGYITATVSAGTIVSSLLSARLIKRLGVGRLVALSTLLTASALVGFAFTENPVFFFALAFPLGLGGGAIDTALNNFVALHYTASQMSFLHCFYGIGVAASPFVMSLALGDAGNWRRGYLIVALIQFIIAAVAFSSLPMWKKVQKKDEAQNKATQRSLGIKELILTRGVLLSALSFFMICAIELTAGAWSASYFVNTKGLRADRAAMITMLFYVGLALGRFLSGLAAGRLGRRRILRLSLYLLPVALVIFALPLSAEITAAGLFLIGLGVGPVYPNLSHLTPESFGEDISGSVMGFQQAVTYLGIMTAPSLFGVLAEAFSTALLPVFLFILLLLYTLVILLLMSSVKKKRAEADISGEDIS